MRLRSRIALIVVGSVAATLLSVNVRGTQLEVQDRVCADATFFAALLAASDAIVTHARKRGGVA